MKQHCSLFHDLAHLNSNIKQHTQQYSSSFLFYHGSIYRWWWRYVLLSFFSVFRYITFHSLSGITQFLLPLLLRGHWQPIIVHPGCSFLDLSSLSLLIFTHMWTSFFLLLLLSAPSVAATMGTALRGTSLLSTKNNSSAPVYQNEVMLSTLLQGSDMSRGAAVNGKNISGLFVASSTTTPGSISVSFVCLPELVGDKIFGNLSTDPTRERPGLADSKALQLFLTIAKATEVTADNIPFMAGPSFKGDARACFAPLNLEADTDYVILAVPSCFFAPWGIHGVLIGVVTADIMSLFQDMHSSVGPAWLQILSSHSAEMGQLILDNMATLQDILPTLPSGSTPIADPFGSFAAVPVDQENGIHSDVCARLRDALAEYHTTAPVAVIGANLTSPLGGASTVGGDLDGDPSSSKPSSEVLRRLAIYQLQHARVQKDSAGDFKFVKPNLRSSTVAAASILKKNYAASAVFGVVRGLQVSLNGSRDVHARRCRFDAASEKVVQAFLLHGVGVQSLRSFDSIGELERCVTGLHALHLLPDNKLAAAKRRAAADAAATRTNEELMGETADKLSNLQTTAVLSTQITTLWAMQTAMSTATLLAYVFVDFDPTALEADCPLLHFMAYQFGDLLHDKKFDDWFYRQVHAQQVKFLFWIFSKLHDILQDILQLGAEEINIQFILGGTHQLIDTAPYLLIENAITQTVASVSGFIHGTQEVPTHSFYTSSSVYQHLEEKKQAEYLKSLKRSLPTSMTPDGPPTKRQGGPPRGQQLFTPSPGNNYRPRVEGELTWTPPAGAQGIRRLMVPAPPLCPQVQSYCIPHVIEGMRCMKGSNCGFYHPPNFNDWHCRMVGTWDDHQKSTPGLSWNPKLAPRNQVDRKVGSG